MRDDKTRPYKLWGRRYVREPLRAVVVTPAADPPPTGGPNVRWLESSEMHVRPWDLSEGMYVAVSPFGEFTYATKDRDKIADHLIRLAGEIRRA